MNRNVSGYESHHVIFDFILNKKTGTLHFQPHGRKLYFDSGNLIFANSEHPKEHFSEILVEMDVLDAATLFNIRQSLGEAKSLGKYLKEQAIATPKQLAQSLKHQITKIVEAVISDPQTTCSLQEDSVPNKLPKLKIQSLALVLQAISHIENQENMLAQMPLDQAIIPTQLFEGRRAELGFPDAYEDFFDYITRNKATSAQLGKEFRWGHRLTDSTIYSLYILGMIEFQETEEEMEASLHPITIEDEPFHEAAEEDDLLADVLPEDQAASIEPPLAPIEDQGPSLLDDSGEGQSPEFEGATTAPHEIEIGADTNPTLDTDFAAMNLAAGMAAEDPQALDETISEPIQPSLFDEPSPLDEDALDETLVDNEPLDDPEPMLLEEDNPADFSDLGDEPVQSFAMDSEEGSLDNEMIPDDGLADGGSAWESDPPVEFGGFSDDASDLEDDAFTDNQEEAAPFDESYGSETTGFGDLETQDEGSTGFGDLEKLDDLPEEEDGLLEDEEPDFDVRDLDDENSLVEEDEPAFDDVSLDDAFEKSLAEASGISAEDFQDLKTDLDPGQTFAEITLDSASADGFSKGGQPIAEYTDSDTIPGQNITAEDLKFPQDTEEDSRQTVPDGVVMPDQPEEDHYEPTKKKSKAGAYALIGLLLAAAIGAAYYFMFMKVEDPYASFTPAATNTSQPTDPTAGSPSDTPPMDEDSEAEPPPAFPETENEQPDAIAEVDQAEADLPQSQPPAQPEPEPQESEPAASVNPEPAEQAQPAQSRPQQPAPAGESLTVEDLNLMTQNTLSAYQQQDNNFSLVIVVACSPSTVNNLLSSSAGEDILVFPRYLDNRTCYMVSWGLFSTLQEANDNKSQLPEAFRLSDDPTWVVNLKKYR